MKTTYDGDGDHDDDRCSAIVLSLKGSKFKSVPDSYKNGLPISSEVFVRQ